MLRPLCKPQTAAYLDFHLQAAGGKEGLDCSKPYPAFLHSRASRPVGTRDGHLRRPRPTSAASEGITLPAGIPEPEIDMQRDGRQLRLQIRWPDRALVLTGRYLHLFPWVQAAGGFEEV